MDLDDGDRRVLRILGLSDDATERDVRTTVLELQAESRALEAQIKISERERARLVAQVEELRSRNHGTERETFLRDAIYSGRILEADSDVYGSLFDKAPEQARAMIAQRVAGSARVIGHRR